MSFYLLTGVFYVPLAKLPRVQEKAMKSDKSQRDLENMTDRPVIKLAADLFDHGEGSDLVVRTAASTYQLHQIFIRCRSTSLALLCRLETAEDGWLRGSVDLRREDPEAVDCMLQYLYKDNYQVPDLANIAEVKDEKSSDIRCATEPPLLHVKVYRLAEKYSLGGLRLLALKNFKTSSENLWRTESFLKAARDVYTGAKGWDQDLCNVVIGIFATRKEPLLREGRASALLLDVPVLALHLLKFPNPWS